MQKSLQKLLSRLRFVDEPMSLTELEEDFNDIGLTIQTNREKLFLCKIKDGKPACESVFEDHIPVCAATADLSRQVKQKIYDFIMENYVSQSMTVERKTHEGNFGLYGGSFNGVLGLTWAPTADKYYKFSIEYTPLSVFFYVNDELLHTKAGAHQSYFMTLPITIENLNTAGSTDISFETIGMYIARQGCGCNFKTAYTANNIRRCGAYTTQATINTPVDGFYFELDNATFSVNSRANSGTVSSVAS